MIKAYSIFTRYLFVRFLRADRNKVVWCTGRTPCSLLPNAAFDLFIIFINKNNDLVFHVRKILCYDQYKITTKNRTRKNSGFSLSFPVLIRTAGRLAIIRNFYQKGDGHMKFEHLLSPMKVGNRIYKNRIVSAPIRYLSSALMAPTISPAELLRKKRANSSGWLSPISPLYTSPAESTKNP